jgi:uncharacterized protein
MPSPHCTIASSPAGSLARRRDLRQSTCLFVTQVPHYNVPLLMTKGFAIRTALLAMLAASACTRREAHVAPQLDLLPPTLLADGHDSGVLAIRSTSLEPPLVKASNPHAIIVESLSGAAGDWRVRLRAGVLPGPVRIDVSFPNTPPASADLMVQLAPEDSLEDGTPDFLRLDDEHDRRAFRRWFTYIAEVQYFQAPAERPVEISDCAALIRYAYREALRLHDAAWASEARLPMVPPFESVAKYHYPYTAVGPALFRVAAGSFRAADAGGAAFTQFADARTLWRSNCHFVSRSIAAAEPGDLLFFRQDAGEEAFHSMIYLGESQLRNDGGRYLVYHTGPRDGGPGEIRRPAVGELLHFPRAEWRPVESNPGFLGVYRWNILCPRGTR